MSQKSLMLGLPAAILLGGSAIAFGVFPGVRDWVDQSMPWLGINGTRQSASDSMAGTMQEPPKNTDVDKTVRIDPTMQLDPTVQPETGMQRMEQQQFSSPAPRSEVEFAGGSLPAPANTLLMNAPALPGSNTEIRLAQARTLETVPQTGQYVPSRDNGTVTVEDAQVRFFEVNSVAAQADGKITEMSVDEGSMIEAGKPLIVIDTRLVEKEIRVSESELVAAMLKAKDDSNIKFSIAAEKVAKVEVRISKELQEKGAEGTMEGLKKTLELEKAGFQVDVSQIQKKTDLADVDVKQAKLEAAKVQLELRTILAPRTGMVTNVEKRQYDWVRAGEVILKLTSMKKLRIRGKVKVVDSPHLLLNAPAKVTISIVRGQNETIDGVVSFVAPQTTGIPNEYFVHIDVENRLTPDGQYLFREGMQAIVDITPRNR